MDVQSGGRDDRAGYQRLLAEVRRLRAEKRPVVVTVAALDRFGRHLLERVRCREELKGLGVPTHSVREGGEVSDLVANVLGAVAQEESRRLGERVLAGRDHLTARGWKAPGRAPWGYTWRAATDAERREGAPRSALAIDPLCSPYAVEAFTRAARGESVRSVAAWAATLSPLARGGRNLAYNSLRAALSAPVYIARIDDRNEPDVLARPRGHWPALVSDEVFATIQTRIASHAKVPRQASGRFLLTGTVRCACGSRMVGTARGGSGREARYLCARRMHGAAGAATDCRSSVTAGELDRGVLDAVTAIIEPLATTNAPLRSELRRAWANLGRTPEVEGEAKRRGSLGAPGGVGP